MRGDRPRRVRLHRLVAFGVTVLVALALTAPAFALTEAKMTVDQGAGGQPTRFTFAATSDADALVSSIDFVFPEGFGIEDVVVDVTLLEGLDRIHVGYSQKLTPPSTVTVIFDPPIPPTSNLFMQIRNVMTVREGGTYPIGVSYSAETTGAAPGIETRSAEGVSVTYATPTWQEEAARWLDRQAWVKAWNDVKPLGLFLKPQQIVQAVPLLFGGWLMSLALVLIAFPISIVGGLATAFMKMSKVPPVRWFAQIYINVIRGTPLFLQIFVVFIGLRSAGIRVHDFISAVAVLAFNSSAYLAEIFRAGIQSISKGQFEAASSLGMTYWQAMRYVIIPQTVRRVLPTMTSEFILLFKDTALLAAIGIFELMMYSKNFVAKSGNLSAFVIAAVYYLIVTIPLINLVSRLEAKLAQSEHGVAAAPRKPRRGGRRPVATGDASYLGVAPDMLSGPDFDATAAKHESR